MHVFCVVFCRSLFDLFVLVLLVIVVCVLLRYTAFDYPVDIFKLLHQWSHTNAGADPGRGAPGAPPPPPLKLEKIWFFGVKLWFFTRNTPKIFAPPSARRPHKLAVLDPPLKCILYIQDTMDISWSSSYEGPSWSCSHGSLIYNYLCNQCVSPLNLWVRIPLMARFTRYNHYVIKFVSNLRQVGGFFLVLRFPPPIKLTTAI